MQTRLRQALGVALGSIGTLLIGMSGYVYLSYRSLDSGSEAALDQLFDFLIESYAILIGGLGLTGLAVVLSGVAVYSALD